MPSPEDLGFTPSHATLNAAEKRKQKYDALEASKRMQGPAQVNSPLDMQTGGDHYKKLKVQPVFYNWANKIPFIEGCCIKYLTRWRDKGGVEDLRKSMHLHELLIYFETTPIVLIEQERIVELERLLDRANLDFTLSPADDKHPLRRNEDATGKGTG